MDVTLCLCKHLYPFHIWDMTGLYFIDMDLQTQGLSVNLCYLSLLDVMKRDVPKNLMVSYYWYIH